MRTFDKINYLKKNFFFFIVTTCKQIITYRKKLVSRNVSII